MNIDYNAVIEILKSFLSNEKVEILGISVGEERQVRDAIKNILTAYEKEKEKNMVTVPTSSYILQDRIHSLEKEKNERLIQCHYQYEEMTGIDLLLPSKEE